MDFRTYDPAIGRFLQVDPLAEMAMSWTPFHFTHNTPINGTDPSGLSCAGCPNGEGGWGTSPNHGDSNSVINEPKYIGGNGGNTDPPVNGGNLPTATVTATRLPKSTNYETVTTTEDEYREQSVKSKLDDYYWNSLVFTPGGEMVGIQPDGSFGYGKTGLSGLNSIDDPFTAGLGYGILRAIVKSGISSMSKPFVHYTTQEGYEAIMKSMVLNPSFGLKNARFGSGQYLTNIYPNMFTAGQTSYRLFGIPWNTSKLTHHIIIETKGLNIIKNKAFNFLHLSTKPLNLNGRILGGGSSIFKAKK